MKLMVYIKSRDDVVVGGTIEWDRATGMISYDMDIDSIGDLLQDVKGKSIPYRTSIEKDGVIYEIDKVVQPTDDGYVEALGSYLKKNSEWYVRMESTINKSTDIVKAPPGPPPKGSGWAWREETNRWYKPNKEEKDRLKRRREHMENTPSLGVTAKEVRAMFKDDDVIPLGDIDLDAMEDGEEIMAEYSGILGNLIMSPHPTNEDVYMIVMDTVYAHPDMTDRGGLVKYTDKIEELAEQEGYAVAAGFVMNPRIPVGLAKRGYVPMTVAGKRVDVSKDTDFTSPVMPYDEWESHSILPRDMKEEVKADVYEMSRGLPIGMTWVKEF